MEVIYMNNTEEGVVMKDNEIFFISMDVIDECLDEAIDKAEIIEYKPC
jgi:hypothetical protein